MIDSTMALAEAINRLGAAVETANRLLLAMEMRHAGTGGAGSVLPTVYASGGGAVAYFGAGGVGGSAKSARASPGNPYAFPPKPEPPA